MGPLARPHPLRGVRLPRVAWLLASLFAAAPVARAQDEGSSLPPRVWQPIELDFRGVPAEASDDAPNPFLDFRLEVEFHGPSGQTYRVPGFFDGDGAGGSAGSVWRARFTPDEAGSWHWLVSYRGGPRVAISKDPLAGAPFPPLNGKEGSLIVEARDSAAPGFWSLGRLEHVAGHYFRTAAGGPWIKTGTNSPENFLAFDGFDDMISGLTVHHYWGHRSDWRPGDPDWGSTAGRGIIGAINYLADAGANSIFMLLMNVGGDTRDVWPWIGPIDRNGSPNNDNTHFHLGRMRQWNIVFEHAQRRGILLHFALNEAESRNKRELDDALLGVERKLYYREMVARFAHHNAVQWNICEEYDIKLPLPPLRVKRFAGWLQDLDPYRHPITVHQFQDPVVSWAPFVGDPRFSTTAFQFPTDDATTQTLGSKVEDWRRYTTALRRPIPIAIDEVRRTAGHNFDRQRTQFYWPVILSGGNLEQILSSLFQTEDFSPYRDSFRWAANARSFLEKSFPFWEMEPADELVTGVPDAECFAKASASYAIYLPETGFAKLDLSAVTPGKLFRIDWFHARKGTYQPGRIFRAGPNPINLGAPAFPRDVAILVRALDEAPNAPPALELTVDSAATTITLSDEDGLRDLDIQGSLLFRVDRVDRTRWLLDQIRSGRVLVRLESPYRMSIVIPINLRGHALTAGICDRQGLCAGQGD
ncbi:MAG TPA: DUF5060 domain-containing protein [Planctomycetota bacterium]